MDLVLTISDYVYVLDFGRVIAQGHPDQVREEPAVIAAYLGQPREATVAEAKPAGSGS
jgi:branched-chain amino acid transport system ATP-binding protein